MAEPKQLGVGASLLHYKILGRLGEGGMGEVFRAEDVRLGRTVALKVLRRDLAGDEEFTRRFQREVRAVSAVSHPGVATLYDVHQDGDLVFYTMEYVAGRNLRDVLESGPLPIPQLLAAAVQTAEALAEAHRRGVLHRDLKPENVMEADSGFYKILDFGLARFTPDGLVPFGAASQMETVTKDTTQAGKLVGTVSYMSPEQAQGSEVDLRSDIFAFGTLLHELATGTAPFTRHNAIATFHAIVHEQAAPVTSLRPELPQELEWIVARCLAKDPSRRYQSAAELAEDLRTLRAGTESGLRRLARIRPRAGGSFQSRGVALATAGVAAIALLAALASLWIGFRLAKPEAPSPLFPGTGMPVAPAAADLNRKNIAVSAFTNRTGDAEHDWMRDGIPEMLTTELAADAELKVISTQRLNDLLAMAGRDRNEPVDGATATELARWAGAGIVISGAIFKSGESLRLDAQAYDTATGHVLAAAKAEGGDVFGMVNGLTRDLREGLSLAASDGEAPSAVMTASSEAFRHYSSGAGLYEDLRFAEASREFGEAVKADPQFTLARMRLGMSLYLEGNRESGLREMGEAAKAAEKLPERERRLAMILKTFFADKDVAAGEDEVVAYAKQFPEDQEANFWMAQAVADLDGDRVGAIRVLHKVIKSEPENLPAVSVLSTLLAGLGQSADAERILRDYLVRRPDAAGPLNDLIGACQASAPAGS